MSPIIKRYWVAPGSFPAPPHEETGDGQLSVRSYSRGKWSPDTDIYEVGDGLVIIVDIAGVNKEKVLAAKRAGLTTVILPKLNQKDLDEAPEAAKAGMNFIFVDHIDEAVRKALHDGRQKRRS